MVTSSAWEDQTEVNIRERAGTRKQGVLPERENSHFRTMAVTVPPEVSRNVLAGSDAQNSAG